MNKPITTINMSNTEKHPLEPFLPTNAHTLMLGSFPPKRERWSMEFFYPNRINDMWRIIGHIFFADKHHFENIKEKRFDRDKIINFCAEEGIALYDTAVEVRRLKDNASDKFLEIVTPTDLRTLLTHLPHCRNIVATGEKAATAIAETFGCQQPSIGSSVKLNIDGKEYDFWRMPSTSRAYPLSLEKKAEQYAKLFTKTPTI